MEACSGCPTLPVVGSGDPDPVDAAIDFASTVLFALSGRQFNGACTVSIRPCIGANHGCANGWNRWFGAPYGWLYTYPSLPVRIEGQWWNVGRCEGNCRIHCLTVPGPVNEVTEIRLDGAVLTAGTDYEVMGFNQICRLGREPWPCSQRMDRPVTETGTFQIIYTRGRPITPVMRAFATRLACDFVAAHCGDDTCLPANISSVSRDGENISFTDVNDIFPDGLTAYPDINLWLSTVNPNKAVRPATVVRADGPKLYRRT